MALLHGEEPHTAEFPLNASLPPPEDSSSPATNDTSPSPRGSLGGPPGGPPESPKGAKEEEELPFETEDFHWTSQGISHPRRRRQILAKYPELSELNGYDLRAGFYSFCVLCLNVFMCYKVSCWDLSWGWLFLLTYAVSGTLNHILFLAMHEASHCLLFPYRGLHDYYSILLNLSMGVPAAVGFKVYHLEHHVFLGTEGLDQDIPSYLEARLLSSFLGKIIFVLLMPLTYSLRPMLLRPKPLTCINFLNWAAVILWDLFVYRYFGFKSLFYLLGGSVFSMSFHPLNGHLIAEHYQFPWGERIQETFSTYGLENIITFNVGYHIEHHDFPSVPGYRLPLIKQKAAEFYDLPHHRCWLFCLLEFLFNKKVSPYSRVKRIDKKGGQVPPPHKQMVKEPEQLGAFWLYNKKENKKED